PTTPAVEVPKPVGSSDRPPQPADASVTVSDTAAWLREPIDGRLALGLGVVWYALYWIAGALEPATSRPEPLIGLLRQGAMLVGVFVMLVGLAVRRRWGLVATVGESMLLVAAAVACPISGHHSFGAWWVGQMACVLAMVAVSTAALRRAGSLTPR